MKLIKHYQKLALLETLQLLYSHVYILCPVKNIAIYSVFVKNNVYILCIKKKLLSCYDSKCEFVYIFIL